jgi:hypothetical protein
MGFEKLEEIEYGIRERKASVETWQREGRPDVDQDLLLRG